MDRDILSIDELIICTDVSGSIGTLPSDSIIVSYEVVGYFLARVVLLEMICAMGRPIAYTLGNVTIDGFDSLHKGIKRLLAELDLTLPSISSSETNFTPTMSAASITLIGRRTGEVDLSDRPLALAGLPLVGEEVENGKVVEVSQVYKMLQDDRINSVLPVGSKGILYETETNYNKSVSSDKVDLYKSAGPSTCCIVSYNDDSVIDDYNLIRLY